MTIDPGADGGFAVFEDGVIVKTMATPNTKNHKNDTIIEADVISNFFADNGVDEVWIEDVHAIYGAGAKSTFNFGRNVGIVESLIVSYGYNLNKITPHQWQRVSWRGTPIIKKKDGSNDTKKRSLYALDMQYPELEKSLKLKNSKCRVPHDGIVDAILIGHAIINK